MASPLPLGLKPFNNTKPPPSHKSSLYGIKYVAVGLLYFYALLIFKAYPIDDIILSTNASSFSCKLSLVIVSLIISVPNASAGLQ